MELKDKKLFLLDMDGTIYLDNDLFDGTIDFLNEVKAKGGRYLPMHTLRSLNPLELKQARMNF